MPLDAQSQLIVDALEAASATPLEEQSPEEARAMYIAFAGGIVCDAPVAEVTDHTVPGPHGDIPVRVYRPEGDGPFGAYVHLHGGGWVIGSIDTADADCRSLAAGAGCVVVSVDYRLAPEHPFPVPLDDCYAATCWVAEHGSDLGIDRSRVAVGGDSAGGNLAAAVALRARDEGGPRLSFQLLLYPVTDHSFSQPSYVENAEGYFLTAAGMRWFSAHYLDGADPTDPLAAPLRAPDLSGLPPALVLTAEFDPLRDEGEAYGARLAEAGVPCTVTRYDGTIHGFFGMAHLLDAGKAAVAEASAALRQAVGADAG